MIERGLQKPGRTKGGLAAAMGVRPGAVSEILSGARLIKASEIQPIIDYLELNAVPIMGRVGAGASIGPELEQVPPEGLGEVELPFPIAEGTIAFEVVGDFDAAEIRKRRYYCGIPRSAAPAFELLRRGSRGSPKTGERYLKTIERGNAANVVNLTSFNAKPIMAVKLEWIGG